jgi:SSS family solute:Na+ symporter
MSIDSWIVLVYFALTITTGLVFQKIGRTSISSFFRGGGGMMWWMVGTTMFLTQFSAWTFTGAAAKAYADGFIVLGVFIGNVAGFFASYLFFAARYRQSRVDTGGELVRYRYGPRNEQFFTWLTIPLSLVSSGLWLNSLAIFASLILKMDIVAVIWITGIVVTGVSVLSGAWGIVASDFIQSLVVFVVSVTTAVVALFAVGGPVQIVENFPSGFFLGPDMNFPIIVVGTFFFFMIKQIQTNNTMFSAYRFLTARDSKSARKGAVLAICLMTLGLLVWFIPPWAAAILYPDANTFYSGLLGNKAAEAVYLVFVERTMPAGTVGLLTACLFAATMSSMDSSLNRDTGIIIKSFYNPVVRKNKAGEKELLRVSFMLSALSGLFTILIALFYNTLKHLSLFDLSMQIATIAQAPMLVPLFFGMVIRKTPDWSGWVTVLFGIMISVLLSTVFTVGNMAGWAGIEFTRREIADLTVMWNIFAHLVFTGGFFCLTSLFYKEPVGERQKEVAQFYANISTPVIKNNDAEQIALDKQQRGKIGVLVMISGFTILLLVLVPNPAWGRLLFASAGLLVAAIGFGLYRASLMAEIPETQPEPPFTENINLDDIDEEMTPV